MGMYWDCVGNIIGLCWERKVLIVIRLCCWIRELWFKKIEQGFCFE